MTTERLPLNTGFPFAAQSRDTQPDSHHYGWLNAETIPGWAHDITNIGADEMAVMRWANEILDRPPDTIASKI